MGLIILLWFLCGIAIHVQQANKMKTWCGTPVWEEPTTYVMFFPAMIAGPVLLLFMSKDDKSNE
jgi:hypothetical protein